MSAPDPAAAIADFLAEAHNSARIEDIICDFARVGIARPSRSAIIDHATDVGMSGETAALVADIVALTLGAKAYERV